MEDVLREMIRDINSLGRMREREETKLWLEWRNGRSNNFCQEIVAIHGWNDWTVRWNNKLVERVSSRAKRLKLIESSALVMNVVTK